MAFEQFLPDYFAECAEHLATVRRVLLELEESGATDAPVTVPELLRALHTLKGLSGMVGLASAERLAHGMEEGLRAWNVAASPLSPGSLQALFTGVALLESCIAFRRGDVGEPPDVETYLAGLDELIGETAAAGIGTEAPAPGRARRGAAAGATLYDVEFTPTPELSERGIGVEAVRQHLSGLGVIRSALPYVGPQGAIVFRFQVEAPAGAVEPREAWTEANLQWRVVDTVESAQAPPAAPAPLPVRIGMGSVLRVELARVDELMRMVGELVVTRSRLGEALRQANGTSGAAWESLHDSAVLLERQLRTLREGITRIRLVQIGEVFERLRFAVRELARETGRRVTLELAGQETEIDKMVVERMLEPLLHLVRNAVSHGIEPPDVRVAKGKRAEGRVSLRAAASGDRITIVVEDDGAGIDAHSVAARAAERGLIDEASELSGAALLDVLCVPGFSTREAADLASGRGVGMNVVRSTVRQIGGDVLMTTEPGRGTRFAIELPLTLLIVDALLVEVADQVMAVPQPVLREVFLLDDSIITKFESNEVVSYRERPLPLLRLRTLFGLPAGTARGAVLVVGTDAQPVGLVVDRLLGLREIVVQPVADPLIALPGIGGATELGDGRISLVLDAAALTRLTHSSAGAHHTQPAPAAHA